MISSMRINELAYFKSIFVVFNSKLSKIDGSVTESTMLEFMLFDFAVVHLMSATFASVIIAVDDRAIKSVQGLLSS